MEQIWHERSILSALTLHIAAIGVPRAGNAGLVDYFHSLVQQYREKFKFDITAYSVQGYNDGMCLRLVSNKVNFESPSSLVKGFQLFHPE